MRILLCLNRDFMSNLALNLLWEKLEGHAIDIVLSNGIGKKSSPKPPEIVEWQQLEHRLIEQGLFPLLESGKVTRGFRSFNQLAQTTVSKTIREFVDINQGEGLAYVRHFHPDAIVSIRFGQIFKPPVIAIPRFGILNLHSGILPEYRGILATFWAMLNDETQVGCTLHYVADGTIDTGNIIGIHKIPVDKQRSLLWHIASLYEGGAAMTSDAIAALNSNSPPQGRPQNDLRSRYFSFPEREDAGAFLAKGYCLHSPEDYAELLQRYGVDGSALYAGTRD